MLARYAERKGWKVEVMSLSEASASLRPGKRSAPVGVEVMLGQ